MGVNRTKSVCPSTMGARGTGRGRPKGPHPSSHATPAPTDDAASGLAFWLGLMPVWKACPVVTLHNVDAMGADYAMQQASQTTRQLI
jgi:hypothetical protein